MLIANNCYNFYHFVVKIKNMYLKSLYVYYLTIQFKYYLNFLFLFVPFCFKKQTKMQFNQL